ncbi:MAG TPA: hypothetical protein VM802_00025 [Chitinophaga sp.]|uniref:hypothetical protein n=1 Tax=Chitinophaga sp. TaxID=1869181 RepID=UPI002BC98890|nr:hypothetical protein [Chitinophaga sp.]HVI43214.1 hypothetical protein [Chitinophaga sp.]
MALLIVSALSEDTIAAPGNANPNYITVSVTDNSGNPVTGLVAANFQVQPMIVAPGGSLVNITTVAAITFPGFYLVNVVPVPGQTWKLGVYIFAVVVVRGADRGQAQCSVLLD